MLVHFVHLRDKFVQFYILVTQAIINPIEKRLVLRKGHSTDSCVQRLNVDLEISLGFHPHG